MMMRILAALAADSGTLRRSVWLDVERAVESIHLGAETISDALPYWGEDLGSRRTWRSSGPIT